MLTFLKKLRRDERGVSALEYAILAALLLGIIVAGITGLGTEITSIFTDAATELSEARP